MVGSAVTVNIVSLRVIETLMAVFVIEAAAELRVGANEEEGVWSIVVEAEVGYGRRRAGSITLPHVSRQKTEIKASTVEEMLTTS